MNIKEIAQRSGVSVATVSRVINNNPKVKLETKNKVLSVINETNYYPQFIAQNMRGRKTNMILVVIPDIINPVFNVMIDGIVQTLNLRGYKTIITVREGNPSTISTYTDLLKGRQVEGAIFVSSSIKKELFIELNQSYNVVMCSEYFDDVDMPIITINNEEAAYEITKYLIRLGKKNIAYFSAKGESSSSKNRKKGIIKALDEFTINYTPNNFQKSNSKKFDFGNQVIDHIIKYPDTDALIINSDFQAVYALKALKKFKRNIDIVSFDGTYFLDIIDDNITCIKQPFFEIGTKAVEVLLNKIEGKSYEKHNVLAYKLINGI